MDILAYWGRRKKKTAKKWHCHQGGGLMSKTIFLIVLKEWESSKGGGTWYMSFFKLQPTMFKNNKASKNDL